jgi:hypothetical protein
LIVLASPLRAETVHLTAISHYLKGGSTTEQWETAFPQAASSMFLLASNDLHGNFVNLFDPTVPFTVATGIDITLHAGDNEFVALMAVLDTDLADLQQPGGLFGLSLRFDDASAPGISATIPVGAVGDDAFGADGGAVPTFPASDDTVMGANALSTSVGGQTIRLTRYQFSPVTGLDRVTQSVTAPDTFDDFVLKFTVNVGDASATPLPSTAMAGAALLPTLMLIGRRRRRREAASGAGG